MRQSNTATIMSYLHRPSALSVGEFSQHFANHGMNFGGAEKTVYVRVSDSNYQLPHQMIINTGPQHPSHNVYYQQSTVIVGSVCVQRPWAY